MNIYRDDIQSPVGTLAIVSDDTSLRALHFIDHAADAERLHRLLQAQFGTVDFRVSQARLDIRGRLESYFAGDLHALDAVPTRPSGTAFQIAVWAALQTIPVGTTTSYGRLARALGAPKATRAVGLANGANPIAIVIPCHRVIGADGTLTGYGGGLERKAWLLRHEGVAVGSSRMRSDRELPLFS